MPTVLHVDGTRLNRMLDDLRQIGRTPGGGVERIAYTESDRTGRALVSSWMEEAGLTVHVDAAGNIIGRRAGSTERLPPIMMGSHIDSVPDGGAFDGPVGTLAALEVAWTLGERRIETNHPIEVVVFQNEEGGLYGSGAIVGALTSSDLAQQTLSGKTVAEGTAFIGGDPDTIAAAGRKPGQVAAYFELHIEQGAVLERAGTTIGVVEGIVGIGEWQVTVHGAANHAGTTPMDQRQDALLAAARFIQVVNEIVTREPGRQVGTVGQIRVDPGAHNVIPGEVVLSLELRDLEAEKIQSLFESVRRAAAQIGDETGTRFNFTDRELDIRPAPTDRELRNLIQRAAADLNLSYQLLPSGAGHDAQNMALIAPIGMVFIPSVGGISHSPDEFSRPDDIVAGANVLGTAVLSLDSQTAVSGPG